MTSIGATAASYDEQWYNRLLYEGQLYDERCNRCLYDEERCNRSLYDERLCDEQYNRRLCAEQWRSRCLHGERLYTGSSMMCGSMTAVLMDSLWQAVVQPEPL